MTTPVIIKFPCEGKTPNPYARRVVVVKAEDGGAYEELRTVREGEAVSFTLHKGVTLTVTEEPCH